MNGVFYFLFYQKAKRPNSTKLDRKSKMLSAQLRYPFLGKLRAADLEKFVSNSLEYF
jgi:hypothetical protein